MNGIRRLAISVIAVGCFVAVVGLSACAPAATIDELYRKQVKPLLAERCFTCHGALKQEGGLRLDTAEAVRRGGDSGPSVDAKQVDRSLLIERVTAKNIDERMPPEGEGAALKPEELALLREWIAAGSPGPADEKPESDPRAHWSFRPPVRPAVPQVKNSAWVRNPIDAFIAAEHEKRGLRPQPEAEASLLCRRLYLDLVGLPPTQEQIQSFVQDYSQADSAKREAAYAALVDRLLASPQYGERWGRHWMDVWRYSDWWGLGEQVRNSQKHIWHWRDWIVESLNDDVGYDEMIRQMLAADELYPDDLQKLRAGGFLARNYFLFNRQTWLDGVVTHVSKGFLGLTLNCSKCHDHKYDPFPQADYYRLRAFFEPHQIRTDLVPGEGDFEKDGIPRPFDCDLDAPTYRFVRGDEFKPVKDEPIAPGLPQLLLPIELKIEPVELPPTAADPGLRPWVFADLLKAAEGRVATAEAELLKARADLAKAEASPKKAEVKVEEKVAAPTPAAPSVEELQAVVALAEAALRRTETARESLKARGAADVARRDASSAKGDSAKGPSAKQAEDRATKTAQAAALAEKRAAVAAAAEGLAKLELDYVRIAADRKAAQQKKVDTGRETLKKAEADLAATEKKPTTKYASIRGAQKANASSTETADERDRPFPKTSTGRRTALAKLLTDRANPLTARVAVNHIWMRHLGTPLVPTVFEFGRKGNPPTHPELLDWLAVELRGQGTGDRGEETESRKQKSEGEPLTPRPSPLTPSAWSMKHLHRLIVLSSTYRMGSSSAENVSAKADPDNVYYWHRAPIRLEAQVVRDALLHLSGELDLTVGGPSLPTVAQQFSKRRSLYFVHSHNEQHRFLTMFDDADVLECYRRDQSIVPQQALTLANSKQSLEAAAKIADAMSKRSSATTEDGFLRVAFTTILACEPTTEELAACREALTAWRKLPAATKDADVEARARMNLVHALLNHNDFVTLK